MHSFFPSIPFVARQAGSDCRPCLPAPSAQQTGVRRPRKGALLPNWAFLWDVIRCKCSGRRQLPLCPMGQSASPSLPVPWPFFSVFTFFLCHTIAVFPTPDADDDVAPVRVQHVLAWRDRLPRSGRRRIEHSQPSSPSAHSPARFEHLAGHGQSEIAEMAVAAGDRRRNPSVPILRCKAALRRPTTAHPRAHQSVEIFLAASHTVARRLRETWDRPLTMEIPASSLGKGTLESHNTVPYRPSRRHLALACGIWPCCATTPTLRHVDFFFPPSPPLNRPASGHLERTAVPPPLPSSVPVAGSFAIACGLVFDFPVSAPSPRCPPPVAATPPLPLEPPLGDDRYLFPSHELAFLVPDRGGVSEAGWARLIKPPLVLTAAHCSPVNAPVSRRAVEGWLPPASLPPVSPRPDGWRGSRRVRPTTRTR